MLTKHLLTAWMMIPLKIRVSSIGRPLTFWNYVMMYTCTHTHTHTHTHIHMRARTPIYTHSHNRIFTIFTLSPEFLVVD